jgi:hypothetical protein
VNASRSSGSTGIGVAGPFAEMPSSRIVRHAAPSSPGDVARAVGDQADAEVDHRHVERAEVGPHGAGLLGRGEQLHRPRARSARARGTRSRPRAAQQQRVLEAAVRACIRHMPRTKVVEALPRVLDLERASASSTARSILSSKSASISASLSGKRPVHGAHARRPRRGDLVERDVEPAVGEDLGGGGEDALAIALGVGAQGRGVQPSG